MTTDGGDSPTVVGVDFKALIREVPNWTKEGILFYDIMPVVGNYEAFKEAVTLMAEPYKGKGIDVVVGTEARGFLFGPALAQALGCGFTPVRKPGKLPWKTIAETYDLEYGTDTVEIHKDGVLPGQNALVADDLLATGGTAKTTGTLVERLGGIVAGFCFFVELDFLKGGERMLKGYERHSVVHYEK